VLIMAGCLVLLLFLALLSFSGNADGEILLLLLFMLSSYFKENPLVIFKKIPNCIFQNVCFSS
jgi:hypothetical protein